MKKYEASSSDVEVIGQAITALQQSIQAEEYAAIMAEYKLDNIDPQTWYPYQLLLDFYKTLAAEGTGSSNLIAIGMTIIEAAVLPPEIDSIPTALHTLNGIIELNMRGPVVDKYEVEKVGEKHYRVRDLTAFPHDLNFGFLHGIVRRFGDAQADSVIERTYRNADDPDQDGAVYDVRW